MATDAPAAPAATTTPVVETPRRTAPLLDPSDLLEGLPRCNPKLEHEAILYAIQHLGETSKTWWPALPEFMKLPIADPDRPYAFPPEGRGTGRQKAHAPINPLLDADGRPVTKNVRAFRFVGQGYRNHISFEDGEFARARQRQRIVKLRLWCPVRAIDPDLGTPGDHASYDGFDPENTTDPTSGCCPTCVDQAVQTTRDTEYGARFWEAYASQVRKRAHAISRLRD